jgi:hypothetical protein
MVNRLEEEIEEAAGKEARIRQSKAAKRYWRDAFGLDTVSDSYYVNATVLRGKHGRREISQAMTWESRLQGPFVMIGDNEDGMTCQCIESFGNAGVVEGFVVARQDAASTSCEVGFGIIPGRGVVLLPRFEFESVDDCYEIDDLVRGTGMIVERALIRNDDEGEEKEGATVANSRALVLSVPGMRTCSLVVDPLDDQMVHIATNSRIVTASTTALAVTSKCFQSRLDGKSIRDSNADMTSIRTKVWSSFDSIQGTLVGAGVSKDVHLGHILVAMMSDGKIFEVVRLFDNASETSHLLANCSQVQQKS